MDIIKEYLVRLGFDLDMPSFNKMKGIISDAEKHVQAGTASMAQGVTQMKGHLGGTAGVISGAMEKVKGIFSGTSGHVKEVFGKIRERFVGAAGAASQMAGKVGGSLSGMSGFASKAGTAVNTAFTKMGTHMEGLTKKGKDFTASATKNLQQYAQMAMATGNAAIAAAAAVAAALATAVGATVGIVDKVAMADRRYALLGQKMLMTKEQAREMDMITKTLGVDLEDIQWNPELREDAIKYSQLMKSLTKGLGGDFDEEMKRVRDLHTAIGGFKITAQFALMNFAKSISQHLGFGDLTKKLWDWNREIGKRLPEIADKVGYYVAKIFTRVGDALKNFGALYTTIIGVISGDKSLQSSEFKWENLAKAIKKVAWALENYVGGIVVFVTKETQAVGHFLTSVNAYGEAIGTYLNEINDKLMKLAAKIHVWMMESIQRTKKFLMETFGPIFNWMGETAGKLFTALGTLGGKMWGVIAGGWKKITGVVGGWIDAFMETKIGKMISKMAELLGIADKLRGIGDEGKKAADDTSKGIADLGNQVGGFFANVGKDIKDFWAPSEEVKGKWAKGSEELKEMVKADNEGTKALTDAWNKIQEGPPKNYMEWAKSPTAEAAEETQGIRVHVSTGEGAVMPLGTPYGLMQTPPVAGTAQTMSAVSTNPTQEAAAGAASAGVGTIPNKAQLLAGATVGQAAPSAQGAMITHLAAGIRAIEGYNPHFAENNNPGNLIFAHQRGAVKGPGGFAKFQSLEAGEKALEWQLGNYRDRNMTLRQLINTYAPPNTKNEAGGVQTKEATEAYYNSLSKRLGGLPLDTPLKQIEGAYNAAHPQAMPPPAGPGLVGLRTGSRSIIAEPMASMADRAAATMPSSAPDLRATGGGGGTTNQSVTINVPISFSGVDHGKVSNEVQAAIQRGADGAARRLQNTSNQRNLTELAPQWG